ncbi:MAG: hypothetical protein IJ785_06155 [Bacteroidales bacterium]|nr:hypothetical protein [Bacteroidales bacterium]
MKKAIVLFGMLGVFGVLRAQNSFTFNWHGFANPHYYADSRSVVGGREDMMLFYPKPIVRDSLGRDINDGWQANMLAITARLNLTVNGPEIWGAQSRAFIEGDFTGATNATNNNLRLRHAYIALEWDNHKLLMGQYWYAMVVHEIMPMTNPLNMGAPFHPYARQPQVRYSYFPTPNWELMAVAQWQLDNTSQGLLNGTAQSSTLFARHSLLPEMNAQLRYRHGNLLVGAAANLKSIQPVVNTTGTAAPQQLHQSFTYSLFGSYRWGQVTFKCQTLLNNSLYEGCSLGGYLMYNFIDGVPTSFRDWHFNTVWLDIERTHGHWRPGIFFGYAENAEKNVAPPSYGPVTVLGRGYDLAYLWRIQPRLTYTTLKGLSFTGEAEYTYAGYVEPVGNLRLSLSAVYAF